MQSESAPTAGPIHTSIWVRAGSKERGPEKDRIACGHEGRQRRRLGQPCNRPCKLCARAVMRHFATRGQLEFVCPWSLVPSYALRARHRLLPVITVTAYREVPKPCYTARRLPLSPLIASEHPLLHIVKTSPASPCRLNLFLSPRNPAMGGGLRPMAKPAESGAHRRYTLSDAAKTSNMRRAVGRRLCVTPRRASRHGPDVVRD